MSVFLQWLSRFERLACALALLGVAALILADVLLRELSGNGVYFAQQLGVYGNLVVALIGIGLASQSGTHLRPRFADHWLPARWDSAVQTLAELVTALVFLGFAGFSLQWVWSGVLLLERSTVLGTLLWPVQALLPASFLLAALRHGCFALRPSLRPRLDSLVE